MSLSYSPATGFSGPEQFTYTVSDGVETSTATVTVVVDAPSEGEEAVAFTVQVLGLDGNLIESIPSSDPNAFTTCGHFRVRVLVDDIRDIESTARGVRSAFADLTFDPSIAFVTEELIGPPGGPPLNPELTFGPFFEGDGIGDFMSNSGIVDEVGNSQGVRPDHPSPVELFTVTMQAIRSGTISFATNQADSALNTVVLISNPGQEVPSSQLIFGNATLTIAIPELFAEDDIINIPQDSAETMIPVLDNDTDYTCRAVIETGSVTDPANGTIRVLDNQVYYRSDTGFVGTDRFQYTLFDPIAQTQSTAEVVVSVGIAPEFQNPTNPFDVNADGDVLPVDALVVLNALADQNASGESAVRRREVYIDVNGDGKSSPIDALLVLNELQRQSLRGEGESFYEGTFTDLDDDDEDALLEELAIDISQSRQLA